MKWILMSVVFSPWIFSSIVPFSSHLLELQPENDSSLPVLSLSLITTPEENEVIGFKLSNDEGKELATASYDSNEFIDTPREFEFFQGAIKIEVPPTFDPSEGGEVYVKTCQKISKFERNCEEFEFLLRGEQGDWFVFHQPENAFCSTEVKSIGYSVKKLPFFTEVRLFL